MNKYSGAQVGQMMKLAAENVRALSTENQGLRTSNEELMSKVAQYEKHERAEKIAAAMEEKGLEPETTMETKVENLMAREDLSVLEQAVTLSASQVKTASVAEGGARVPVEGDTEGDMATTQFAANLASLG